MGGWDSQGPQLLYDALNSYNEKKATIHVVAIGPDDQYAVVTNEGSSWNAKEDCGFAEMMRRINTDDIQTISFGPEGTWAIVMKNGFCHERCLLGTDGPKDKINEHQNNIKYVSMTGNKGEWIVGYGNNGWCSRGCDNGMITYMKGVIVGSTLVRVNLGGSATTWLVEAQGGYRFSIAQSSNFHAKHEGSRLRCVG